MLALISAHCLDRNSAVAVAAEAEAAAVGQNSAAAAVEVVAHQQ